MSGKLRIIGVFLLATCSWSSLTGQQLPQYALTAFSLVEMNPAATGVGEGLVVTGATRRQWNNLPGSPAGYHLSAHLPLPMFSSGVGVSILQDEAGVQSNLEVVGLYSFQRSFRSGWMASVGIGAGFFQSGLDGAAIRTPDGTYPGGGPIDHGDGTLPTSRVDATSALLHAGLLVTGPQFDVGVAGRYIQGGALRFSDQGGQTARVGLQPHILAHASWKVETGPVEWRPTAIYRTDLTEHQAEAQLFLTWKDRFLVGFGARGLGEATRDALLWSGGIRFSDRLLLIYGYETGLSQLRQAHSNSFELMLRYEIGVQAGQGVLPGVIYNPRFL